MLCPALAIRFRAGQFLPLLQDTRFVRATHQEHPRQDATRDVAVRDASQRGGRVLVGQVAFDDFQPRVQAALLPGARRRWAVR